MSFKYTEIEKIPVEWEVKMIQEIGEVVSGGTPKTKEDSYWDGNISWITPKDLSNFTERYIEVGERSITELGLKNSSAKLLPKGTVLFSSRAPIGYLAIARKELCTNQGFKNIVCDKKYSSNEFLFYMLKAKKNEIESIAGGSTFKEVSGKVVKEFKIPMPPLNEQKAIAHILSTLDDKIEVNNQINKTIENMAQAIFKQWFVDFEFPNEDGEPYKSSGGEMVESERGMIPKGWEVVNMSDICEVRDGTHDSPKAVDVGYYLITSKHLKNNYIEFSDAKYISENDYHKVNERSKVDRYDILITMIGTVGNIYLVQDEKINFAIKNVGLFKTSTNQNYYDFIYLLLKSKEMQQYIEQRLAGSTQKYISLTELRKIPFIIPTKAILKRFKEVSNPILDMIYYNEKENSRLKSIRDSLLPKLMSGEIRVPLD